MTERALKIELFDQFARVAQAAASGRRVEIVDVLANGERSVEELSRQVAMSVANTSRHLQVLKEAGLVAATRDGTRVHYRLASPALYPVWVALRAVRTGLLRRKRSVPSVGTVAPPDTSATGCRNGPTPGMVSSRTEPVVPLRTDERG